MLCHWIPASTGEGLGLTLLTCPAAAAEYVELERWQRYEEQQQLKSVGRGWGVHCKHQQKSVSRRGPFLDHGKDLSQRQQQLQGSRLGAFCCVQR